MKVSVHAWAVFTLACCFWTSRSWAAPAPDDQAKKLVRAAMARSYMAGDFDGALQKLKQADAFCEQKGCTPSVRAQIYGALATVHWMGNDEYELAVQDLHAMVRLDPRQQLDDTYAPPELREALDTARVDVQKEGHEPAAPPWASTKEEEFRRQVEARKAQAAREAEEERKAADAEAARILAEQKKAERIRKQQEARKAAEDKREAARKAAEDKKAEILRKAVEAKKAAEDRKEAERKAAEEKKEAERKAAEEKKVEMARKAEEERQAREEALMKTPPPVSHMQETPWKEQTIGYPIPVAVKIPAPPPNIERPRVEIAKVLVEYYGPAMIIPQQVELKPLGGGSYGGLLPCEASVQEGFVTYFTIAINKYENLVSIGASRDKPHKVRIRPASTGIFPHLPGALPPRVCTAEESRPKVAGSPAACQSNVECPDGGVCTNSACATVAPAPPVPAATKRAGCRRCEAGSDDGTSSGGMALALCAGAIWLLGKRRRVTRACQ
jgi:hypothetical protein